MNLKVMKFIIMSTTIKKTIFLYLRHAIKRMMRMLGIEPRSTAWQAVIIPLNHIRFGILASGNFNLSIIYRFTML